MSQPAEPSAKYLELIGLYRHLHNTGEQNRGLSAPQTFSGKSLRPQLHRIKQLIAKTSAKNLLDYGAGKGSLYNTFIQPEDNPSAQTTVVDYWGVDMVHCYDPAYAPFQKLPNRIFDGVICTDVLEHCAEQDIPWIIEQLFRYASRFVFISVASYAANKTLPNGENAHCTIKPAKWWRDAILNIARHHPEKQWELWVESNEKDPLTQTRVETCFSKDNELLAEADK